MATALLIGAFPLLAMAVAIGWWLEGREDVAIQGDLRALGVEVDAAARAPHPLLATTEPGGWTIVADAKPLHRAASSPLDDARSILGEPARGAAVPSVRLRSGVLAWATPHTLRLVHPTSHDLLARVRTCDGAVQSVQQVDELLVIGACGALTGVTSSGTVAWRTTPMARTRIQLLPVSDGLLAARGASVERLDLETGTSSWTHRPRETVTALRALGGDAVAVASSGSGVARVDVLDVSDGTPRWTRRFPGWSVAALEADSRRVVVALVDDGAGERCGRSRIVELDGTRGAGGAARPIDRRMVVSDLRVDGRTGRMVASVQPRRCTLQRVEPRVDVYGARGLERLQSLALPASACSNLTVRASLAAVATCNEVVALDVRSGEQVWSTPLPVVPTRRSTAMTATRERLILSDDVGSLLVLEAPPAR